MRIHIYTYTTAISEAALISHSNKAIHDSTLLAPSGVRRLNYDGKICLVYNPLCENATSFTKPEVHNVLHCRQRRPEPRPQATCIENVARFGHVVFETCEQTNRQTYGYADRNTLPLPRAK